MYRLHNPCSVIMTRCRISLLLFCLLPFGNAQGISLAEKRPLIFAALNQQRYEELLKASAKELSGLPVAVEDNIMTYIGPAEEAFPPSLIMHEVIAIPVEALPKLQAMGITPDLINQSYQLAVLALIDGNFGLLGSENDGPLCALNASLGSNHEESTIHWSTPEQTPGWFQYERKPFYFHFIAEKRKLASPEQPLFVLKKVRRVEFGKQEYNGGWAGPWGYSRAQKTTQTLIIL